VRRRITEPHQTAAVRFGGRAGQRVTARWQGPSISDTADRALFDGAHQMPTKWSGSDDDRSDVITLPGTGTYTVGARFDDDTTGDGRLSVDPA
jgi:hypothetical protein